MTQHAEQLTPDPVRAPWWSSPYLQGFLAALVVGTLASIAAGYYGLQPLFAPLLVDVQAQALLLMMLSLWVVLHSLEHIVSKTQAELGMWFPVKVVLSMSLLIPMHDGASALSSLFLTALNWGASFM